MKLTTFFVLLMLVPEFAMAQELASEVNTSSSMNEQTALPTDPSGHGTTAAPSNNSPIKLNALYTGSKFMAVSDPAGAIKQSGHPEQGVIEDWREQMFKTISEYFGPHQEDPSQVNRMPTDNKLGKQTDEGRIVMKLVLKETLKFTKERVVEIDRLVKALKYEVSSDKTGHEDAGAEANDIKTGNNTTAEKKPGGTHPAGNTVVKDRVILKTGLRVRIDSGKLGLVSETEARYRNASYFYKVNLDNQGHNSLGFRYVLGKDTYIQVERDFNRTLNPAAKNKPSTNLIQLGCRF